MTQVQENDFKRRLLAGESLHGLWTSLASPVAAEALSLVGFDWLLFDSEHAPVEIAQLQALLQAAAAGGSHCAVRPAWNDKVLIKRMLDIGAQTVLVPFVETPEEASEAVKATRYPPNGVRGVAGLTRASRYGMTSDYLKAANDNICLIVQLESTAALERLEEIAAVEGVDGIFIGPSDLSASMGRIGAPQDPEVQEVLKRSAERILTAGKTPGVLAANAEDAKRYLAWGYRFVAGTTDLGLLMAGARSALAAMRQVPAPGTSELP